MTVLVIDGANVVGSVPDGWWKDRAGAARRLHDRLMVADLSHDEVVLVLEGAAKGGVKVGRDGHPGVPAKDCDGGAKRGRQNPSWGGGLVRVVHAPRDGDSEIERVTAAARESGEAVTVVTADRVLQSRVQGLGAMAMGPAWLLDQLG